MSRIDQRLVPTPGSVATQQAEATALYEHDFFTWTEQQAGQLRAGRTDLLDVANLAEEIESLGKSQLAALTSSYRLIAMHLLKFLVQPDKASASWLTTIVRERGNIELTLGDNPGLKPKRAERFAKAYGIARRDAAIETRLVLSRFPTQAPFDVDDVESPDFWPAAAQALLGSPIERSTDA